MTIAEQIIEAQYMLSEYMKAEVAVLSGQSYSIKDRSLARADLGMIIKGREYWQARVKVLEASSISGASGGIRLKQVIIRD